MRFAYSTNAFKKYSLEEAIRLIKEIGFAGVELLADRPHLYPPDYSQQKVKTLKDQLNALGLKVSNLNTFTMEGYPGGDMHHPSWIEKDANLRRVRIQHTKDCLKPARELDCPNISIQPGGRVEHLSPDESMKVFIEGLNEVIPLARQLNIRILVEPEPHLLMENAKQFEEFITKVETGVIGLNCDVGHFYCAGEDPTAVIRKLAKHIHHIHIEDIKNRVHNHLICGQGEMDFKAIFDALQDIKYNGIISVELYPYQDRPVEAGEQSLKFLQQYT
ncbi:MAG: sugar phosphate isomerase/epimerase [Planctomycetes bacterium]|nr:sugar phosphate isomerase/epimerase [Planctomycetota bacterium]